MPVPQYSEPIVTDEEARPDAVRARIERAILDGTLAPGDVIEPDDLERWLGVSIEEARTVIGRLTASGLLKIIAPGNRAIVTGANLTTVDDMLRFTGYQAGVALTLAIPRMTDEQIDTATSLVDDMISASRAGDGPLLYVAARRFVGFVTDLTGNDVFARMIRDAGSRLEELLRSVRPMLGGARERIEWYTKLRDAIGQRDADYAEYCFRQQHQLTFLPDPLD